MSIAIGIDLGTTNSCAAIMESGRPRIITTAEGSTQVPSVFAVDADGNQIVGLAAAQQAEHNPDGTVRAAKRLIGRNFHSKSINDTRQVFTYEMVEGTGDNILLNVAEHLYTLEQISAAILMRIKEVAEANLGRAVSQAVITVPAYFNERQRASVREAGRMAGFEVLRILNEPTAAALVYGLGRRLNQRVAVYDLGGGTFDISIIDIKGRVYEVVATGGDTFLGGVDFDDRLMQYVLEDFHTKHGVDLSFDRSAIQRIRDAAEATKIALSTHNQAHIQLERIHQADGQSLDIDLVVTRDTLEQLTADLVRRTIATAKRIFADAGCRPSEVDRVLMVGGQSRMPMVHRAVEKLTATPVDQTLDPEHAVGMGAAIMAQAVRKPSSSSVTLRDVLSIPIGIRGAQDAMHVLFEKQCKLPARQTRALTTHKDGQRSIMLRIYQGEHEQTDDNELIGTFVFSGIRMAKAGAVGLQVTFDLNAEGELKVSAHDPSTDDHVQAHIRFNVDGQKATRPARPRRPMRPNTPTADAPLDDELLPLSPMTASISMPTPTFASTIDGDRKSEVDALFDDTPPRPPEPGLFARLGRALFGR
ncbi:MAG: Hsp70 family protein [Myxococcota bacterium]|nr:Hsp70 family protein [Myxococcota bacterium]MEC9389584.1 Hsp70 family protein [Myxococcota bacterium]